MTHLLENLARPIPFDQISPEQVEPSILSLIKSAEGALAQIATGPSDSYESTFAALDAATQALEVAMGVVEHLESVKSSPELRAAYNAVLPSVSDFWSSISLNAALYAALKKFADSSAVQELSPLKRRHVEQTISHFQRQGAELGAAEKQRLLEVDRELSLVTTTFSQNVLDHTAKFSLVVDESRVRGLPASALSAARESAEAAGEVGFRFTLQAPSLTAVLTYADDPSLREEVWIAFNRRGVGGRPVNENAEGSNLPLVARILELRREKARLLGFDNFADLATEERMARSGKEAIAFVSDLREKTEAAFVREQAELLAFRRKLEGPEAPPLQPWDVGYYAEKQRLAEFDFDEEKLRPYLSAENVLKGAFSLAHELYGVTISDSDLPVWHESVKSHCLKNESGKVLGYFYTDLYPRPEKRDGAWMHGLVTASETDEHVALFCLNAQPPTADAPSLLSFRDTETVFHEFGHLLHHLLSDVPVRSLACTRVAQDFVELPSQILENWCSEKEALDKFARHYQTGEPIGDELMTKLLSARKFRAASAQMRQLGFAALDLDLHVRFLKERDGDLNLYANRIIAQYSPTALPEDYALIASFGHLFSHPVGYAAGYYSYKWAEVLDADAFSRFKEEGIFNPKTGRAFLDAILSRGDSRDPGDLFIEFMGRPPRPEPMLERQGLLS